MLLDSPATGPMLVRPVDEALACAGRDPSAAVVLLPVESVGGPTVWLDGRRLGLSIVIVVCNGSEVMSRVITSRPSSVVSVDGASVELLEVFVNGATTVVVVAEVQVVEFQSLVVLDGELEFPSFGDWDVVLAGRPSMVDVALSALVALGPDTVVTFVGLVWSLVGTAGQAERQDALYPP